MEQIPKPEAALRELLKGKSEYHQPEVPVALAPYKLERISLPSSLENLPEARDLLPENARRYLLGRELMLREEGAYDAPRPYWDPVLANNKKHYREFIEKLNSVGMLQFTQHPKNHVGVFFVHKSDKQKIRLIVDARSSNALFKEPPGVELCSSEGFSRIECEVSEGVLPGSAEFLQELQSMELHVGLSDVKDCFHRLKQPRWLAEYFCFMPIKAHWVGLTGKCLDGVTLGCNDIVYPMPGSLCMGFSWSLYFCQQINEHQCALTRSLGDSTLITDKGLPVVFKSSAVRDNARATTRHYVYVDNLGIVSPHRGVVQSALQELDSHFGGKGLLLHPGEVHSEETKALGTILDGKNLCSRICPERYHKVRQSIRGLLQKPRVTGQMVEVVLGHATFCALNNRMLMSIFHSCYKFIRAHYFEPVAMWEAVRREFTAFSGLMIFLRADWWRPWNSLVCCSDASTTGYGVCTSHWRLEDVRKVGRQKERSRFKRCDNHSARESALTSAGFIRDELTGAWKAGNLSTEDYLNLSGWRLDQSFEEVPARLLRKQLWQPKLWGKWRFNEGIIILEARAAVKAMKRIAMSRYGSQTRQLFLLDNMSLTLALERSRSRQYGLLRQVRVFNAYCIARGIQPSFRWIPSELNSSDEPSRFGTDEPSKLLTSEIPHGPEENQTASRPGERCPSKGGQSGASVEAWKACCAESFEQEGGLVEACRDQRAPGNKGSAGKTAHAGESRGGDQNPGSRSLHVQQFRQQQRGRHDQEEKEVLAQSRPTPEAQICGLPHRRQGQGWAESFGEESHWNSRRENVPERASGLQGLCGVSGTGPERCRGGGQVDGAVHEPLLFGRTPGLCWRPPHSQLVAPSPTVQQDWGEEDPQSPEVSERLAKTLPWTVASSVPFEHLVCSGMSDDQHGFSQDGRFCDASSVDLQSPLRVVAAEDLQFDQTGTRSDQQLELASEPRRVAGEFKDWRLRRQCPVRLSLYELLAWQVPHGHEEGQQQLGPVGLRLQSVPGSDKEDCQEDGGATGALSHEAQRPLHRQKPKVQVAARGTEERPVEEFKVMREVRESRPVGSDLGASAAEDKGLRPGLRGGVRRHHAWKKEVSRLQPPRRNGKGQFVADLFSGCGGVALACERLGFVSKQWDIRLGHTCDLTSRSVVRKLKCSIRTGKVLAVMMAPPCNSFSVARDRTKVIRTREFPWGLPDCFLTASEQEKIQLGNACFRTCFSLIRMLDRFRIPWILENPASSKCWHLPFWKQLCSQPHIQVVYADFCRFGTAWKKHTRFVCGNIELTDLHRVNLQCTGRSICSVTGKSHFHLTGKGPGGRNWTEIAQPYPKLLCSGLAHALTARYHYNYVSY